MAGATVACTSCANGHSNNISGPSAAWKHANHHCSCVHCSCTHTLNSPTRLRQVAASGNTVAEVCGVAGQHSQMLQHSASSEPIHPFVEQVTVTDCSI